ncbi:unnamed protein product, partial [Amoebophrya sp. A120]|eukprot:GSA120T00009686001.1
MNGAHMEAAHPAVGPPGQPGTTPGVPPGQHRIEHHTSMTFKKTNEDPSRYHFHLLMKKNLDIHWKNGKWKQFLCIF